MRGMFLLASAASVPTVTAAPVVDPVAVLEARIVTIKSLIQDALTAAPKNTATRVITPLKTAMTK